MYQMKKTLLIYWSTNRSILQSLHHIQNLKFPVARQEVYWEQKGQPSASTDVLNSGQQGGKKGQPFLLFYFFNKRKE